MTPLPIRVAELAALVAIAAPLLGWLGMLLPLERGTTAYELALTGFAAFGLLGLVASGAAVSALLFARFAGRWENARTALVLTLLGPASWFFTWVIATIAWTIWLNTPGATDDFFDVFGAAH